MADGTAIEWTDATWSPLRARRRDTGKVGQHCERVSPGCTNCYAATHNRRNLPNGGTGLDYVRASRDAVDTFVDERVLSQPLRWREPRRIFVCNQTDLFADFYTDEQRDRVFAVMALADRHTFQVLTKRPDRMRAYLSDDDLDDRIGEVWFRKVGEWPMRSEQQIACGRGRTSCNWPLRNVWLGVTAEDQQRADERIPILLDTPAAVRFVSAEPLLGQVDLGRANGLPVYHEAESVTDRCMPSGDARVRAGRGWVKHDGNLHPWLDWVIVGGESGPRARPCDVAWIRSIVAQCRAASVPVFVKQLGDVAIWNGIGAVADNPPRGAHKVVVGDSERFQLNLSRKGGDLYEWPQDMRVREFPRAREVVAT